MALEVIHPFTYQEFNAHAGDTAQAIINYFTNHNLNFWTETLRRYSFRHTDYQQGIETRLEFNEKITSCTDAEFFAVVNEILEWGGMDSLTDEINQELRRSIDCLDRLARNEIVTLNELCVERLASISKIYEMWDLDNWIIYDSYCARGLQWIVSSLWQSLGHRTNERLLKLPWPPGRVGSPFAGFPRTADTAPKQKRLAFIYGSWFCKAIAERLITIENTSFNWRPFHIEMIAFQLGHEIRG
ncbi:MAG: hypothetical protein LUQ65_03635 [Candidatus Helarchaeota archaeon]|nr:hypothetical protein [Candidatus Helarchaeota archaeon]